MAESKMWHNFKCLGWISWEVLANMSKNLRSRKVSLTRSTTRYVCLGQRGMGGNPKVFGSGNWTRRSCNAVLSKSWVTLQQIQIFFIHSPFWVNGIFLEHWCVLDRGGGISKLVTMILHIPKMRKAFKKYKNEKNVSQLLSRQKAFETFSDIMNTYEHRERFRSKKNGKK